jgi:hypothetical protein
MRAFRAGHFIFAGGMNNDKKIQAHGLSEVRAIVGHDALFGIGGRGSSNGGKCRRCQSNC